MATKTTFRKYDDQFKLNALKMVDNGQSVRWVAQSLGVNEKLAPQVEKRPQHKLQFGGSRSRGTTR